MATKREELTKTCTKCNQEFPATLEYFHKAYDKYLKGKCKTCSNLESKLWKKSNQDYIKSHRKKYRAENLDQESTRFKEWASKNKDFRKIWHKKNPGKLSGYARKRRALEVSNKFEKYQEAEVLNMYGTNCYLCDMPIDLNAPRGVGQPGWRSGLHIEHFVAITNGGPDTLENVRPSHGWCNLSKGRY
jgi:hypothetical protein